MPRTARQKRLADAKNRAVRTVWQSVALDLAVAVAVAVLAWLPDADLSSRTAWLILATAVAKGLLQAAAAFVMRYKIDPSPIPTPLPPSDPGQPDDPAV